MLTGGIPAEYVGAPGLLSSVITKSGTNQFSGSVNYFFQNDGLVAENRNAADLEFSRFDAAVTGGGPIVVNEAWFFGSYRRLERTNTVVAMDYRNDNPCNRIGPVLGPQQDLVQHMRALPHRDVAAAVETVRASGAAPVVTLAFEFLVLTAARSGEVRGAQWAEIFTADHVWTVPATRTKAKREHRVPLCRRAEQIVDAARTHADGNPLVFPSARGKRLNDMALSGLLKDLEIGAVPHGFRSTFRDWAAEETNHPREVVEAALAHVVQNKVEAAYARSDLFERRRQLMDDWAAYVGGGREPDASRRS